MSIENKGQHPSFNLFFQLVTMFDISVDQFFYTEEHRGYGKMTLDEIKKGYKYDKEKDAFVCNHCGQIFNIGQVFQIEGRFDFHGLGLAIKQAREERGWTQAYLAELVGKTDRTIMSIENKGQHL